MATPTSERVRDWASRVLSSLWFVPALLVLAAVILAVGLVWLDGFVSRDALRRYPRLFGADAESSRSTLATIAGSMITVAGVTFSITVVAVAQASTQYTSRILRNFMSDRRNQVVLGAFVGVFVYCLVVLRTIRGGATEFVPAIAVLGAFLLAIITIGLLIYFIHHIATSLQASTLLARVAHETTRTIDQLFPDKLGDERENSVRSDAAPDHQARSWQSIPARSAGYIQNLDQSALRQFAEATSSVVRIDRGIGEFVVVGEPILSCASAEGVLDEQRRNRLQQAFVIGPDRTVARDPAFGFRQITDIALRALSPAVNDTTTAIASVDQLSALLSHLAPRRIARSVYRPRGQPLVMARDPTFQSLLDIAFDEIRRNAAGNVNVLGRMLSAIERIAR